MCTLSSSFRVPFSIVVVTLIVLIRPAPAETRVKLPYATIALAEDALDQHAQGTDSVVHVFKSPRYTLSFDYGRYCATPDAVNGPRGEKGFRERPITVDGRKGVTWSYRYDRYESRPALYLYAVHFRDDSAPAEAPKDGKFPKEGENPTGLTITAECPDPRCEAEILKAFRSIRFPKK